MKKLAIISVLSAIALSANAAPLVTIGDQMDIFFRGAVMGNYNSNVTYAHGNKLDDYAGTLRLGGELDYGRTSKFKANIKMYEDMTKYADHREFNSNLAHIKATASYVESSWKVSAHFSFDQCKQNSADTTIANQDGYLVNYNSWTGGINGSYDFSEKVYGTIGFNWDEIEYIHKWEKIYTSYATYSIPASILYRVTQKVAVGLSYQYRYTDILDGNKANILRFGDARKDHFIGLTVNGEIAPKLTCEAYLGAENRSYNNSTEYDDSDWTMAMNILLGYEVSEKMGVYLKAARDFGTSASNYSQENTSCEMGVNYYINPKVVANASLKYELSDYQGIDRQDDTIWAKIGVSYIPNKFVTLGLSYNYINNESDIEAATYNQHLVSFEASLRY